MRKRYLPCNLHLLCRSRRAASTDFSPSPDGVPPQCVPASRRCRFFCGRGSPPHPAHRRDRCGRIFYSGSRHASRNRGLTGSRRACQAENRALAFLRQGAYGQEFEDSLFYFRKTVVIFLQNLACSCQILIVTGCLIHGSPSSVSI